MAYKTLILMRHGKSDWSSEMEDFKRPLNKRGRKDAPTMGKWLHKQSIYPDILLSSPAKRAVDTAVMVCEALEMDPGGIVYDDAIYEAGREQLLEAIARHGGTAGLLMLFGHNPGLDSLVSYLCAELPPETANGKLMTTAAIAILERDGTDWQLEQGGWRLKQLQRPKEL